jgi:hypothetical protein
LFAAAGNPQPPAVGFFMRGSFDPASAISYRLSANSVEKLILKLSVLWVCNMQISFSIQ